MIFSHDVAILRPNVFVKSSHGDFILANLLPVLEFPCASVLESHSSAASWPKIQVLFIATQSECDPPQTNCVSVQIKITRPRPSPQNASLVMC